MKIHLIFIFVAAVFCYLLIPPPSVEPKHSLTVQLMKIHLIFIFAAAVFCYLLVVFRSYSDSQLEIGATGTEDDVIIQIDAPNQETATQNEGINEVVFSELSPGAFPIATQRFPRVEALPMESNFGDNQQKIEEDRNPLSFSFQTGFPPQTSYGMVHSDTQFQQEMGATSTQDQVAVGVDTTSGVEAVTKNIYGFDEETWQLGKPKGQSPKY